MPEPQRSDTLPPLNLASEIERRRPGFVRNKKKFTPHVEISSKALEHYQNFNQMNMKKINFYEYLPQRYAATSEQIVKVRNLIYNFKSGRKEAGAEVIGALFIAKSVKGISKKSYNQYK